MSNLETLLDKAIEAGLIEQYENKMHLTVKHPDGEQITFDTGEADAETYLEGLLKAWDLIRCGIVRFKQENEGD